jgi:hypothetical protein
MSTRKQWTWYWAVVVGVVVEAICLYLRFERGRTAVEFNRTAPLLLQLHHMFWAVPLIALLPLLWRRARISGAVCGVSIGFIASDIAHHFLILPALIGETGWHWP